MFTSFGAWTDSIGAWAESSTLLTVYAGIVALLMLSSEIGLQLGRFNNRHLPETNRKPLGGGITGAVAGLLAFMLAFTFGNAASRFQDRKQLVVTEANAIGTAYLRTQLVEDPQGAAIRQLLQRYIDDRANVNRLETEGGLSQAIARSEEIHTRMWAEVSELARKYPDSVAVGLLVSAVNDVIDMHGNRIAVGLRARIPQSIWVTIFFMAIMSTALMGYDMGLSSGRSALARLAMVATFSAVVLLIIDLDRVHQTLFSVSQEAMIDLQRGLGKGTP